MERTPEAYRRQRRTPKALYQTYRIGSSTISGSQVNVPIQLLKNFNLKNGDVLEWYPCATEFPDDKENEVVAVLIARKKEKA